MSRKRKNPTLPDDPSGYTVEQVSGKVHTRYPDHALDNLFHRTRTKVGVAAVTDKPVLCSDCYPVRTQVVEPPSATQERRESAVEPEVEPEELPG